MGFSHEHRDPGEEKFAGNAFYRLDVDAVETRRWGTREDWNKENSIPNFSQLSSLSLLYISIYSPKDKRTGYRIARVMVIRKKGIASGNK